MRTADIVYHEPSGEKWVVAWADPETGYMAPCGWPTCQARIEDCRIIETATDEKSAELVKKLSTSGRADAGKAAEIAGRQALTGNGRGSE
jgi:hypothetical protein